MGFEKIASFVLVGVIVVAMMIIAFPDPLKKMTGMAINDETDIEQGTIKHFNEKEARLSKFRIDKGHQLMEFFIR